MLYTNFYTSSSETPDEVGISSVLLEDIKNVYLNSFCFGFRFNDINLTIPEFYGYYFRGPIFRREVYPLAQGSTRFNLSKSELIKLKIPIPPVPEQRKIAAILSSVDEAIEKTEAIIEQTEKVKKGLMQQLLTKGIGHTKFKKTEIGEIPEEWEVKNISEVAKVVSGGTPSKQISEYWENGTIPWATPTDITSNDNKYISTTQSMITESALRNSSANLLPVGSVLMTSRATIGPRCINTVPMATNQGVKSFICDPDVLHNEYLYYLIDKIKDQFIALASGSTFLEISKSALENFKIPVPPIEEQIEIAKILSSVDEKMSVEKVKKESLQIIKKGLMHSLLTGKVRVKVDDEVVSS
ncbi:restriction endonuclease subunit S [Saccharococcus thermophilus]|uniref:Type I restriction enzyme S subunit n=2 Tax=Saccharococcus thermophilus TaxID=29396 RepID=A0A846MM10_9BACL|nr:restriction endonuclease subunit S [Saccharococcus thermophilus]NIK16638.1 type I restriction enzyme S subunit [Saccharococcus thermophilus]